MARSPIENAALVKARAAALGFDACGIAAAGPADPDDALGRWLGRGFHADMAWIERTRTVRQDVRLKLPGARSVIVVARNYHVPRPPMPPGAGKVASYAWGRDYHRVLKKPLVALAKYLAELEPGAQSYASVDSGPVLERSWAARAGVGWIGKNSLVLRRDLGSWFFLGTVITTLELVPDAPVSAHCGSCRACIDACPTRAIVEEGVVDSRRCISYLTIENRGEIPHALRRGVGEWIFGCDICQEACPWNRQVPDTSETAFLPRPGLAHLDPAEILAMDNTAFDARFAGSPIRRAKHAGMVRNARIVGENSAYGDKATRKQHR